MKKLFLTTIGVAALLATVHAQTNDQFSVPPPTPQNFLQSVQGYFTSFNTDYTWTNVTIEAQAGYKQVTGEGAASTLAAQYDIGKWNVGAAMQFFGVGSTINQFQAQGGYALLEKYDLKVEADLRAGYNFDDKAFVVEPVVFVKKKLTPNTFADLGIGFPVEFSQAFKRTPSIYVEAGFTF